MPVPWQACHDMDPAIFASSYYPHRGGVEEAVRQLAKEERRAGNRPLVVTMRWPKNLPANEHVDDVPVRRHVFRVPEATCKARLATFGTAPLAIVELAAQLKAHRAGVVHVQCVSGNAWYAEKVARLLRLPLVVTLQGELTMDASAVYERSSVLLPLLCRLLRSADAITACSTATLREAENRCQVDLGDRGSVIHNGVSVADFAGPAALGREKPYVFAIGRLVPQKGFDVLLHAFREVMQDREDVDLLIAGDGPERPKLARLIQDLGIGGRTKLLGPVDRPAVPALFRQAAVFVLPSRREPFGIVNLEAMAAGVPVVATRVGGVSEFVENEVSGLLVAPEAPQKLAAAIKRILTDADLRQRLVSGGTPVAEEHDWSRIALEYRTLYRRVTDLQR